MPDSDEPESVSGVSSAHGASAPFDVFLSHSSLDKPVVETIAERLKRARLEPWLDVWNLVPGADWQAGLVDGLARSSSCAVFVGPGDLGAWENQEVGVALDRAASDPGFRLFLVLLPGLPEPFDATVLSPFLRLRTWSTTAAGSRTSGRSRPLSARSRVYRSGRPCRSRCPTRPVRTAVSKRSTRSTRSSFSVARRTSSDCWRR